METIELLKCQSCNGKGSTVEQGFDGRERVSCANCDGAGHIDFVVSNWAAFEAEVNSAAATVADVEHFLGAIDAPVHANMTASFFDNGVRRAFAAELSISQTGRESLVAVSSTSDPDSYYLVTAETCTCVGHQRVGRCLHRAFAIFYWWVTANDAVAEPIAA